MLSKKICWTQANPTRSETGNIILTSWRERECSAGTWKRCTVMGIATKRTGEYNDVKAETIAVLSKHYKVKLLGGDAGGQTHKYLHWKQ